VVWFGGRQREKVVPVAGEQYAVSLRGKRENCLVGGIAPQGFTQQRYLMTEFRQADNSDRRERHDRAGTSL